jgi:Tfp pilus assembly protein PilO
MSSILQERYIRTKQLAQRAIREYNEKPALRAYMELFLTLLAISLFGLFAIRPTVITIGNLIKEIEAKNETLKIMNEKVNNLYTAKDLYIKEADKIKLINDAVPNQPKPDILALQIEQLSIEKKVIVDSMSIEGIKILGESTDNKQDISLSLGVTGSYFNLINFAEGLEELRRPIKYDSISLTTEKTEKVDGLMMNFGNLSTPYLK